MWDVGCRVGLSEKKRSEFREMDCNTCMQKEKNEKNER